MKFDTICAGEYAVRKAGYMLDLSDNCAGVETEEYRVAYPYLTTPEAENRMGDIIDSLYDLDAAELCRGEDGQLYAVEYAYGADGFVPAAWCPVVPMSIKYAREHAGMTQAKMSECLGIPTRTIADWDRGVRTPPEWTRRLIVEKLLRITYGNDLELKTY